MRPRLGALSNFPEAAVNRLPAGPRRKIAANITHDKRWEQPTATTERQYTIEDLERIRDRVCRYDLIRGELIELPPADGEHGEIAAGIIGRLWSHVSADKLGRVYTSETGFLLRRNPDVVRAPDAAVIRAERVPERQPGFYEVSPDLVVEVVSPSDSASYVQSKVLECLNAGVRMVWVVFPEQQTISIYERSGKVRFLSVDDTLDGDDVLPGFSVPVAQIFE